MFSTRQSSNISAVILNCLENLNRAAQYYECFALKWFPENQTLRSCWNVEYETIDYIYIYKDNCLKGDAVLCKCSYLIIAPIFNVRNSNCNIIKIIHVLLTEMRRTNTKNTIIIMHGNEDTLSEFSQLFFFKNKFIQIK